MHEYLERACGIWGGVGGDTRSGRGVVCSDSDFDKFQGSATRPSLFCSLSGVLLAQRKYGSIICNSIICHNAVIV